MVYSTSSLVQDARQHQRISGRADSLPTLRAPNQASRPSVRLACSVKALVSTALLFVPRMLGAAISGGGDGSLPSQTLLTLASELGGYGGGITWLPMSVALTALAPPANAETTPGFIEGSELQVNSHAPNHQEYPAVARYNQGFAVVWQSLDQTGAGYDVFGQRFTEGGAPLGGEFQVNTYNTSHQRYADVASLDSGGFVVVWQSLGQVTAGTSIHAQIFDPSGAPTGSEIQVNQVSTNNQKWAAVAPVAGGFAVVWQNVNVDYEQGSTYARRFDASGVPQSNEILVNNNTSTGEWSLDISPFNDGYLVLWSEVVVAGSNTDVVAQQFALDGSPVGGGIAVSDYTMNLQSNVGLLLRGDEVLLGWTSMGQDGSNWGVYARRFGLDGQPLGSAFQLNTYTDNIQVFPTMVSTSTGYVTMWQSRFQDGAEYGIYGQQFNASGSTLGSEFRVNNAGSSDQDHPDATTLGSGFVVVWEDLNRDGSGESIFAKVYTAITEAPTPAPSSISDDPTISFTEGAEFRVNTYTSMAQETPAVAKLGNIGFVVVWASESQDPEPSWGIYAQRFDNFGAPVGGEFRVNTLTTNTQRRPAVASSDTEFVVVWQSFVEDGTGWGIFGQRYQLDGTSLGGEYRINSYTTGSQEHPAIAAAATGFVVAWDSDGQDGSGLGVYGQRLNASGGVEGSEFQVSSHTALEQSQPAIARLGTGFVVVWRSDGQDGDLLGVYAQRFDVDGMPLGGEFRVNSYTASHQEQADLAHTNDGFVVVWHSSGQDTSGHGVYGQRFDSTGTPQGSEFRINSHTANDQLEPSVATLDDSFVVVWQSLEQDGQGAGIFGRRFSMNGVSLDGEFQINSHTPNAQTKADIAVIDGGFVVVWSSDVQDSSGTGIYGKVYAAVNSTATQASSPSSDSIAPTQIPASGLSETGVEGPATATMSSYPPISSTAFSPTFTPIGSEMVLRTFSPPRDELAEDGGLSDDIIGAIIGAVVTVLCGIPGFISLLYVIRNRSRDNEGSAKQSKLSSFELASAGSKAGTV